jgi:alkylated DNA repair dioxygenase AlkB
MSAAWWARDHGCVSDARPDELRIDRSASVVRRQLDATSWVDVVSSFVLEPESTFDTVRNDTPWVQNEILRYDKYVPEKRLGAGLAIDRSPLLRQTSMHLRSKYRVEFSGVGALLYRDGDDFQGLHSDREMRWLDDTRIAILSLGAQRPWTLRPRAGRYDDLDEPGRGATHDLSPASGDLVVLGGRCQADWLHAVPKTSAPVGPRISVQWRWTSRRGRPEEGPNFGDPRYFSS